MINYKELEARWQKAWADAKIFEAEPGDKDGLLITAAFPYVNTPQHIGHLRTYGTADAYARYKRMMGFNVLYPMGFHATGTPVLAFAKRIANNDKELLDELKLFHIPEEEIKKMIDPVAIVNYFIPETKRGMMLAGYGIDWRRTFVSIEPLYSKQVEWQFLNMKEKGLLTKGRHPVGWCPNDNSVVGQHDTKHDVQPEIEAVTAIDFEEENGDAFFSCSTYRPETLYGVTNLFVNEKIAYVLARFNNRDHYMSKDSADILKHQFDIQIIKAVDAGELLKKRAVNPINGEAVPILPGYFVKSDIGTGVVMSVPSHAPFDYVALERLKAQGYPMPKMEYRKLIELDPEKGAVAASDTRERGAINREIPALAYLKLMNLELTAQDADIERATKQIYKEEAHRGRMIVGSYIGMPEPEARDRIKQDLIREGNATEIYIMGNEDPVYCRCGYRAVIKVVEDQWFINYGDKAWKEQVREAFSRLTVYPEKYRLTFERVIEWIDLRAAERAQGLGTKFPFNPKHIIESLSDSTLYMCFYTFCHILRSNNIAPEALKPEFFDYVLNSKGSAEAVSKSTGMDSALVQKCRESFDYWYQNTSRHSAPDLVPNHLTMYVFNHVAFLNEEYWPKQIVVNGMVNYEGQKMSKSLGNIIPLVDGIEKYGADPLRFIEIAGAELDTETEFSASGIGSVTSRNEMLYGTITSLQGMPSNELRHIDYWLYSKLNSKIKQASMDMDGLRIKSAYTSIYYDSVSEMKTYLDRGGNNAIVLREFLESITLMIAPVMPHIAEEFWHLLGRTTLAATERWPAVNEAMINKEEELAETIIDGTIADISQGLELTSKIDQNKGKRLKSIRIIIADDWKAEAYNELASSKSISSVMSDQALAAVNRDVLSKFLSQFAKKMQTLMPMEKLTSASALKGFADSKDYLSKRFDAEVTIESESASKSARAPRALPGKPAIDLVWG
jgi:leucyl-tRNA synthetase